VSLIERLDLRPVPGTGLRVRERRWGQVRLRLERGVLSVTLDGLALPFDLVPPGDDPYGTEDLGDAWAVGELDRELASWLQAQPALRHFLDDGGWLGGDGLHFPLEVLDVHEVLAAARLLRALAERLDHAFADTTGWWTDAVDAANARDAVRVAMCVVSRPAATRLDRLIRLLERLVPGPLRDELEAELADRMAEMTSPSLAMSALVATRSEALVEAILAQALEGTWQDVLTLALDMSHREALDAPRQRLEARLLARARAADPEQMAAVDVLEVLTHLDPDAVTSRLLQGTLWSLQLDDERTLRVWASWWRAVSPGRRAEVVGGLELRAAGRRLVRLLRGEPMTWDDARPVLGRYLEEHRFWGLAPEALLRWLVGLVGPPDGALAAGLTSVVVSTYGVRGDDLGQWIELLGRCDGPKAEAQLVHYLEMAQGPARVEAAEALGRMGGPTCLPALREYTGFMQRGTRLGAAALAAIEAIEARHSPSGALSLVDGAGGMTEAASGRLSDDGG
jgi:hypothetical protein